MFFLIAGAILTKVEVTYKLVNVSYNLGLVSQGFTQQVVSVIQNMYYIRLGVSILAVFLRFCDWVLERSSDGVFFFYPLYKEIMTRSYNIIIILDYFSNSVIAITDLCI